MTKVLSAEICPAEFADALKVAASFFSNIQERVDRDGQVHAVDLHGAIVRNFLDTQCWKTHRMIGDIKTQVEEIARRAAYYERAAGSREISDEDIDRCAQQLEDAQYRLAIVEEAYRQACKVYEEVVGKVYMPKVPAIRDEKLTPAEEPKPLSPAMLRLKAARAAAVPNGVLVSGTQH